MFPGQTKTVVVHPSGLGDYTYLSTAPSDNGRTGTLTFSI
jgi:hypothetical protein